MANDSDDASGTHFLNHPEIKQLLTSALSTLVLESDRGAVLVGAAHVDLHLRMLFEAVFPRPMSKKELNRVLKYPGTLSSFSARADVAYLTRLIPRYLYDAINHLRAVRNAVAHSPDSFRLADHEQRLRKMYELGPGVPAAVNRWAGEVIIHTAVKNILKVKDPTSEEEKTAFDTPQEALDFISGRPELMAVLEERRPRYELALGVGLVCGLIVFHREKAKEVLGDDKVISSLTRHESHPPQDGDS
ncbi:MAG: hypothetical protein M3416_02560 [Acidobacteriota bacterium]|nr:hypothetical protein [Acidobacteriota bacterium]